MVDGKLAAIDCCTLFIPLQQICLKNMVCQLLLLTVVQHTIDDNYQY